MIREDGSHGMAVRPLKISDAAMSRLSIRAVNHQAPTDQATGNRRTRYSFSSTHFQLFLFVYYFIFYIFIYYLHVFIFIFIIFLIFLFLIPLF